jgi:nucleoside-diphosphate-sugar epimerase
MFKDKTIIITGGTGSFGNATLNRFLDSDIKEIRIFSRDEKKQDDMRKLYKNDKIKFYIGDVRDYDSIFNAMAGADYVFHAAALKQDQVRKPTFTTTKSMVSSVPWMDFALLTNRRLPGSLGMKVFPKMRAL